MKILWLCSWYPNRYIYHNGFFVRRQAEAVAQFADIATLHAVEKTGEILLPDGSKQQITKEKNFKLGRFPKSQIPNPKYTEGVNFEIEINKKTHFEVIVYFPKTTHPIFKLMNQFKAYHKGYNLIKREWGTPNLIHLHVIISAGIYALFLHFFYKIPFFITEHSSMYRLETGVFKRSNWVFKTIVRQCVKRAKAIIALSPFYASTMQQHGLINRFFYVPNVVDTDLFQLKNELKEIENNDLINAELIKNKELKTFNLIHVSGLHDSIKNITGILNAIKKLSAIRQDFVLTLIGDPFEQPPYKALVRALNIEQFIRFYDFLPIEDVAKQMQKADIFVLFSRFEGLPCVILEAMSVGLPVVATETGGISDWVTEGSGRLVNSEDEAALVENLDFMMTHLHQFNPELIRKKVVETCSYDAVGQAIVNIYQQ